MGRRIFGSEVVRLLNCRQIRLEFLHGFCHRLRSDKGRSRRSRRRELQPNALPATHGISEPTFYNWKAKYGGMTVSEARRLRELEAENAKFKKLLAEAEFDKTALKDLCVGRNATRAVYFPSSFAICPRGSFSTRLATT